MKAYIEIDVPEFQIGQTVTIFFKDTMMVKGQVKRLDRVVVESELPPVVPTNHEVNADEKTN
jgi:hypothetical protein